MKNSGLPWVGKIPSDWEIKRLKYAADYFFKGNGITKDEVFEDGDISCIRYGEIYSKYNGAFVNCISKTKLMVQDSPRHIKKGDILFACTGELVEEIGKNIVYMGDNPCLVGGDIIVMRHQQDPIFMNYALNSYAQTQKSEGKAKLKVVHISSKDIQNLVVLLPTHPEQKAIADFLDGKCAEIDGLLTDLDAEIKNLTEYKKSIIAETVIRGLNPNAPMKSSGIAWAETIPIHWHLHPVYNYFSQRVHKNIFGNEQNLLSLSFGKIIRKDINAVGGLLPASYNTYNIVEAGDIIIRPTDLQNDKRSLRTGLVTEHGIITSAYIALKPNSNIYSPYFHYLLHSYDIKKVFYNMGNGVRQGLNYSEFSRLMLFEPPIEEQKLIATYLDEKCSIIEQSIADKNTQIETLKSYKSSLIYEYVTGKKQVI